MLINRANSSGPISIHAPREGSDSARRVSGCRQSDFNPRSPRGERPPSPVSSHWRETPFQSTLPARGATQLFSVLLSVCNISIHAPREGSDAVLRRHACDGKHFNPRSPRGERRVITNVKDRGWNFNPRSPRGERPIETTNDIVINPISIHAPREGSDPSPWVAQSAARISIHAPREGSDRVAYVSSKFLKISIHAPREGSDHRRRPRRQPRKYFNPRSPRGERHIIDQRDAHKAEFQSTLPARGAT